MSGYGAGPVMVPASATAARALMSSAATGTGSLGGGAGPVPGGWQGGTEHEVVFIFSAAFASAAAYEIEEQLIRDDTEPKSRVLWRPADAVSPPLYPAGLAELIAGG